MFLQQLNEHICISLQGRSLGAGGSTLKHSHFFTFLTPETFRPAVGYFSNVQLDELRVRVIDGICKNSSQRSAPLSMCSQIWYDSGTGIAVWSQFNAMRTKQICNTRFFQSAGNKLFDNIEPASHNFFLRFFPLRWRTLLLVFDCTWPDGLSASLSGSTFSWSSSSTTKGLFSRQHLTSLPSTCVGAVGLGLRSSAVTLSSWRVILLSVTESSADGPASLLILLLCLQLYSCIRPLV